MAGTRHVVVLLVLLVLAVVALSSLTPTVEPFLSQLKDNALTARVLKRLDLEIAGVVVSKYRNAFAAAKAPTSTVSIKCNDAFKVAATEVGKAKAAFSTAFRTKALAASLNASIDKMSAAIKAYVQAKHCSKDARGNTFLKSKQAAVADIDKLKSVLVAA